MAGGLIVSGVVVDGVQGPRESIVATGEAEIRPLIGIGTRLIGF